VVSELDAIERELAALADPERAAHSQRFFRTEPGGYGEGDRFLGIPVPEQRRVARRHRAASLADCERLLESPIHEHRFVALVILVERFRRADADEREAIADLYLARRERVNNWDLVDASAEHLLAERARKRPGLLDELAASPSVWDRRIAIMTTFAYIKCGEAEPTLRLAETLLHDEHDLIHKAVGWMLREVGKRVDAGLLRSFLDRHAAEMPRTMLRYAIERLPAEERRRYMQARAGEAAR
jgi:3-methyladenine DNA glycosylase AlkD